MGLLLVHILITGKSLPFRSPLASAFYFSFDASIKNTIRTALRCSVLIVLDVRFARILTCKTCRLLSLHNPVTMPTLEIPTPSNTRLSHPPFTSELAAESPADQLKRLLLSLSKEPQNSEFRTILRSAADSVREKAFGYNRSVTKKKILKLLGEFDCLELEDLVDETRIKSVELAGALEDLITEAKIIRGKRRRWQEPGKHYNDIYYLRGDTPA